MSSSDGAWFSLLIVLLFGSAAGLRLRFPEASRRAETFVLGVVAVLFFSICGAFLRH